LFLKKIRFKNGEIVVGRSNGSLGQSEAFIWTAETGMQSLTHRLNAAGVVPATDGWSQFSRASGISADMAYRLAQAFGTSVEMWAGMQMQYDLYQAGKLKRPKIDRMAA
jgi:uncharacterized membrane protein